MMCREPVCALCNVFLAFHIGFAVLVISVDMVTFLFNSFLQCEKLLMLGPFSPSAMSSTTMIFFQVLSLGICQCLPPAELDCASHAVHILIVFLASQVYAFQLMWLQRAEMLILYLKYG